MLVTSSRWHEHQGPGIASCHSLHPLDLLISLLSLSITSLFCLILISLSLLSWSLWSCSRSNSRCSLSRIPLFIWTVALATLCTNAKGLLFVDSKDSTLQGLIFPEYEPAADKSLTILFDPAIWINETKYDYFQKRLLYGYRPIFPRLECSFLCFINLWAVFVLSKWKLGKFFLYRYRKAPQGGSRNSSVP